MSMETPSRRFAPLRGDQAVEDIVHRFRARTLPREAWTHQAHLAVGLWHVLRYGEDAALAMLRDGIRAYNEAVGVPNSDTRGYHETVTRYYAWAAARFLERAGPAGLAGLVDAFVDSPLGSKDGIFAFWSRSGLLSVEARRGWVPPDLAPLDAARLEAPVDAGRGAT
ncbi:MAG: hypothetical protein RLZZ276_4134 [Pseudomonadota bacterium]